MGNMSGWQSRPKMMGMPSPLTTKSWPIFNTVILHLSFVEGFAETPIVVWHYIRNFALPAVQGGRADGSSASCRTGGRANPTALNT
jgi:hypothetical protein